MFHSRGRNNKINRIHERVLKITYNDKSSSYRILLAKDKSVLIQDRNIRVLTIEIYKVIEWAPLPLLNKLFVPSQCNYKLSGNKEEVEKKTLVEKET